MDFSEGTALEIVGRLSSAYGVATQKSLAECLGVPAANVSNWVQRDSVPGSAFVKCALDTGSDLHWLTTGKLANAKFEVSPESPKGEALYNEITSNGGKPVLRRIMDAYGFTLQKQLCELLGISSGTVSTWVRRNYFPGDVVVTCALETGASLQWLATGKGAQPGDSSKESTGTSISRKNLAAGVLQDAGSWTVDLSFIPHTLIEPVFISSNTESWIVDASVSGISNGRWLLGIDDKYDVYDIALLPGRKISVTSKGTNFTCGADEVNSAGKVILTMDYNS
ncbi:helix-turn-helix domain-containing protein [Erwiniaceae bacterium BAC15a-03b]|uniref:Helix-turn-helix domain-containing protein n=1 Tax=Winslowiella arboricola TaxID=2978220 RepID=A0A9J6PZ88_9GAMM|nr:phage repressor protein CI [Winslowiella arboricola]MCU5775831.1 helix-turn-helix domain-containing protein [Winslowiella arboricola]MCU5779319.1 helix-turn-helix domain-containing protein [Winslowiella arboricola]